jgi:small-conductance mechanosensitive channel
LGTFSFTVPEADSGIPNQLDLVVTSVTGLREHLRPYSRPRDPSIIPPYNMAGDFHDQYPSLEPFPLFVDSAPPNSENYFSSPMAMAAIQLLASSSSPHVGKPRVSMPAKVSNYLRLRYYQYEVTFGVYFMTPTEKYVFNLIVLTAFTALLYALFFGFQPFVINTLCRSIYYITGSTSSSHEMCAQ